MMEGYRYSFLCFMLKWGYKRPYLVYSQNNSRLFAANLVNEKTLEYRCLMIYLGILKYLEYN